MNETGRSAVTFRYALWNGAWLGFKWTTYIVGPVAGLCLLLGIVVMEFEVSFGRGLAFLRTEDAAAALLAPFGLYLASCLWGVITGVAVAAVSFGFQKCRGRKGIAQSADFALKQSIG
jgi:hypothetical protein